MVRIGFSINFLVIFKVFRLAHNGSDSCGQFQKHCSTLDLYLTTLSFTSNIRQMESRNCSLEVAKVWTLPSLFGVRINTL